MRYQILTALLFIVYSTSYTQGSITPIVGYQTDVNDRVLIEIEADADKYYVLKTRRSDGIEFLTPTSMIIGIGGRLTMTEAAEALPLDRYQVEAFDKSTPFDHDQDGIDDLTEYLDLGLLAPFNYGKQVDPDNGTVTINERLEFKSLSYKGEEGLFNENLLNVELVKFYVFGADTDTASVYFMNTEKHKLHSSFATAEGLGGFQGSGQLPGRVKGHLIFEPNIISANGTQGTFRFSFGPNATYDFATVQKVHDLLVSNMPFIKNNLCYYPADASLTLYDSEKDLYDQTRIHILSAEDLLADLDYQAMHITEGYGFLKVADIFEIPNLRDIVIFEGLPNELSRVGGIITTVPQTPLSHVNLRAIQDNVPNAFIKNAVSNDRIEPLVGKYVYYKTEQADFTIREASVEEVNDWYESIRPTEEQIPPLNLDYQEILSLDDISFDMADGFGAKCSNLATMRDFGFPSYVIPSGFGVPFYHYQEFMKHNDFFAQAAAMIDSDEFRSDLTRREELLKDFRKKIKDGDMPEWMYDDLTTLQNQFPEGTSIRCRSSTNNEDLPGFVGAGLYESKTQHPDEGHISKSIKQVYASIWNLRAFEERDFYRIDHFIASMGVLCHANFNNEQANGVGVSIDPIYQTEGTFYLNNQLGEDLITNPDASSLPEEILLDRDPVTEDDYLIIRYSSQNDGQLLFTEDQLDEMRIYLTEIHDNFEELYDPSPSQKFAMEIEYKITEAGDLSIKQARPWAGFWTSDTAASTNDNDTQDDQQLSVFPNPIDERSIVTFQSTTQSQGVLTITSITGGQVAVSLDIFIQQGSNKIPINEITSALPTGVYAIQIVTDGTRQARHIGMTKIVKQ